MITGHSKPRLLVLTHYFPAHRGGVEIVAGELVKRLGGDFEIRWMAADTDPVPEKMPGVQCEPQPAWNGLEAKGLPWPIWSWRGWGRLRKAVAECDVIHLHDFIYPAHLVAMLLARRHRKPVVITQHIGDIDYQNPLLRLVLRLVNRSFGRWMLSRADQVIFISPRVMAGFSRYTRFSRLPEYWPNGVDAGVFHLASAPERLHLREAHGLRPDLPVVLFVGRFVPRKGLPMLERMARLKSEWQWCFAGQGPLDPAAWNLPNVRVWRGLGGAGLASLYQLADLLVLPSYGEGFPLVVQESLACGTPVLVSEETAAGAAQMPGGITALPLDPLYPEPATWVEAMARRLSDPELACSRALYAREALSRWNWDGVAAAYGTCFTCFAHGKARVVRRHQELPPGH